MKSLLSYTGALLFIGLMAWGCSTPRSAGTSATSGPSPGITAGNASVILADYLRRFPGITVQGSGDNVRVSIRGIHSMEGNNEPLFVINGQRVGHSYSHVSTIVDVNDIASITVLKGTQAGSVYGMAGSNGVIVIRTKSN